jgi:hypothetical protein
MVGGFTTPSNDYDGFRSKYDRMANRLGLQLLAKEQSSQNRLSEVGHVTISKMQESPSHLPQIKVSG